MLKVGASPAPQASKNCRNGLGSIWERARKWPTKWICLKYGTPKFDGLPFFLQEIKQKTIVETNPSLPRPTREFLAIPAMASPTFHPFFPCQVTVFASTGCTRHALLCSALSSFSAMKEASAEVKTSLIRGYSSHQGWRVSRFQNLYLYLQFHLSLWGCLMFCIFRIPSHGLEHRAVPLFQLQLWGNSIYIYMYI